MARIVDLDALVPAPKQARIGGKLYTFPGDCPLSLFLRLQAFGKRIENGEDEGDLLPEVRDEVLELFRVKQPTMGELPDGLGIVGMMSIVGALYGGDETGEEAAPPPRAAPGTRSTSRKKAAARSDS